MKVTEPIKIAGIFKIKEAYMTSIAIKGNSTVIINTDTFYHIVISESMECY